MGYGAVGGGGGTGGITTGQATTIAQNEIKMSRDAGDAPTLDANTATSIPDAHYGANTARLGEPVDWVDIEIEKPANSGTFVTRKMPVY